LCYWHSLRCRFRQHAGSGGGLRLHFGFQIAQKVCGHCMYRGPTDGSVLKIDTTIIATVTVTGKDPGIQHVAFYLNGTPVLEDFNAPYSFTLPISKWVDGAIPDRRSVDARPVYDPTRQHWVDLQHRYNHSAGKQQSFHAHLRHTTRGRAPLTVAVVGDGSGVTDRKCGGQFDQLLESQPAALLGDIYERGTTAEFYNWYAPGFLYGRSNPSPTRRSATMNI